MEIIKLSSTEMAGRTVIALAHVIFAVSLFTLATPAIAAIALHTDNNDPETEGWTRKGSGCCFDLIPVDDNGVLAWQVNDRNNSRFINYAQELTPEQHSAAETNGWVLRANLRVLNLNDAPEAAIVLAYNQENIRDFSLAIGSDADGDPRLQFFENVTSTISGPSLTLEGLGGGYHLYEMIYDPASETVDLWVDGVERISDYAGRIFGTSNSVAWGSGSSADLGGANYNLVEFSVVPVPAAVWLFLGGVPFVFRRR